GARRDPRRARRPALLPSGGRSHALPQHDLSRSFADCQRRRTLPGLPHRSRRRRPRRDPAPHARRVAALSRTRVASATGKPPIPRRLPLEHFEEDILMKLARRHMLDRGNRSLTVAAPIDASATPSKAATVRKRLPDGRHSQLLRVLLLL